MRRHFRGLACDSGCIGCCCLRRMGGPGVALGCSSLPTFTCPGRGGIFGILSGPRQGTTFGKSCTRMYTAVGSFLAPPISISA